MTSGSYEWKLKALTPIWTGDRDQKGDRLIPTGVMGSLRWWFEVLVRGMDGKACDPTCSERCPAPHKEPTDPGHHCVVCELFGCTGWARKFRLMVVDEQGNLLQRQIEAGKTFILRFIPLRPISPEEWCLLDCTLRLIADYGAVGGRIVLKPSDDQARQDGSHHKDYGLIEYGSCPDECRCEKNREYLKSYITRREWRCDFESEAFSWASLRNFWCVKGRYLARQNAQKSTFNQVIGRQEPKRLAQQLQTANDTNRWLAGRQQGSKKVFSFKYPQEGRRTFGFVKPEMVKFDEIKQRLRQVWQTQNYQDSEFIAGKEILERLCRGGVYEL